MTITIDLPDEVHRRLEKQAQGQGRRVAELIARLLEEGEATHLAAVIQEMKAEGLFAATPSTLPPAPADFQLIQVQGQPLLRSHQRGAPLIQRRSSLIQRVLLRDQVPPVRRRAG